MHYVKLIGTILSLSKNSIKITPGYIDQIINDISQITLQDIINIENVVDQNKTCKIGETIRISCKIVNQKLQALKIEKNLITG